MLVLFQLGKKGLTDNFIDTLAKTFKKHELVKVSILKSCCRDRQAAEKIKDEILQKLQNKEKKKFVARRIGYTISIRKW